MRAFLVVSTALLLASCSIADPERSARPARLDELQFDVSSRVESDRLVVETEIWNVSPFILRIPHGACSITVYAYSNEDRSGDPVWNSDQWLQRVVCADILHNLLARPGERVTSPGFNLSIPLAEIVPELLPAGTYHLTAVLEFNPDDVLRTPELPAGSVTISSTVGDKL